MIFNTTSSAYYPSGKEAADRRSNELALQLAEQVSTFFSNVGVEKKYCVPEMNILNRSANLSIGKADVRCVICEIAANISDAETLLNISSYKASASNFATRKAHAQQPNQKGYRGAVEFIKQIHKLFSSIGIQLNQISKGVYQAVILYCRLIIIKLWREGLLVLPITVDLELGSKKFDEFCEFKSSNHRSRPPMFGASYEYCEDLQIQFTALVYDMVNAPSLELKFIEREDGQCYEKLTSILYCSTLYSPEDVTLSSYDDLTRLFCLYDTYDPKKPSDANTLKELSNNTMPFKGAKVAFNEFRKAASRLGYHKRDNLSGHTHAITNAYKSELLQRNTSTQFNFEEVMYEQDEEALFGFFADNDFQSTQEFISRGLINAPDYTNWEVYKNKHLSMPTTSHSSNTKWGWNVIYQYLGYISCWCEMFPEQAKAEAISIPTTLKEFDRETFVVRSHSNQHIDTDQWPRTLGEFLLRKPVSVATWVKSAINSVETNFRFDNEHVGSSGKLLQPTEFTNAWHKSQRGVKLGSLSESVKNVFKRDEYAVSLQVGYALEKFGSYLQERILEGYNPELLGFRSAVIYHTDNPFRLIEIGAKIATPAGIVNFQSHNTLLSGDTLENKPLANVFHWAVPLKHYNDVLRIGVNHKKSLRKAVDSHDCAGFSPIVWYVDEELKHSYKRLDATSKIIENPFSMSKYGTIDTAKAQLVVPLLGPIRGIIVALEQGIRHKHIRFLDKSNFDKYVDSANEHGIVQLLVSTDKSLRKPWKASSHIDVITMLRAEREFQNLRTDVDHLVSYDGKREIDVLFRNASGEAFSELVWSDIWKIFLTISQGVINSSFTDTMENCEFVKMVPLSPKDSMTAQTVERIITADSEFVKRAKVEGKNRNLGFDGEGHRVKLLAILTPHSSRTTYVSHRVGYIPIETVSKNIGHTKIASTIYYNRETEEDKARKVGEYRRANLMIVRGKKSKDEISPMLTTDVSQEQVRESFKQHPRETMSLYGFTSIPIVTVNDEGDEIIKDTGMDLVASTPMSMIAFSSTHICVHNMECPSEIISENGGYQRCGVCRIKICHVDNLISISRMVQRLELDLKANVTSLINLNRNKVTDETVHKIEVAQLKRRESVLKSELLGWQAALRIVEQTRISLLGKTNTNKFVVPAPRLLKESISCETFKMSLAELLLNHMTSMSDVPSLNSPEIQKTVTRIEKKILIDSKNASDEVMNKVEACFVNDSLDPRHIMSPIMSMLDANIITKSQVLEVIESDLSNNQPLVRSPLQNNVAKALSNG